MEHKKKQSHDRVVPDEASEETKKEQVAKMFDSISPRYDFLNHFLSLGIDITWRKRLIRKMMANTPKKILDVATGTADLAVMAAKDKNHKPQKIVGVDISKGMLAKGAEKVKAHGIEDLVTLQYGDSEKLPFSDNSFDAVCVAFGVRNFENLEKGINELKRVIKPGGNVYILEFSQPTIFPLKQLYNFYFLKVLPFIGKSVSKHKKAYSYLPESVSAFPTGKRFVAIMEEAGFKNVVCEQLTFGISALYSASG